ncbi:MAG TPA: PilZ domain-containing protein [Armatimonadota bacterium]|nr:PilZ domain-containing protein [Armatimonadota bacterium]
MSSPDAPEAARRRRYTRIPISLRIEWRARRPGDAAVRPPAISQTLDVAERGLRFVTDRADVGPGTYLDMTLYGPDTRGTAVVLEGIVTWVRPSGSDCEIGVRLLSAPEDGLHALMMAAHEVLGEFSCVCRDVRFCGAAAEDCPAAVEGRNCWQIPHPPCCYWSGGDRDCTHCPVSMLCFLE